MHTIKSLKKYKNFYIIFSYNKNSKQYVLAYILSFNNQFIKVMRTRLIF
jgi:DNA-binding protein